MRNFKHPKLDMAALVAASIIGGTLLSGPSDASDRNDSELTSLGIIPEAFTVSSHDRNTRFTAPCANFETNTYSREH